MDVQIHTTNTTIKIHGKSDKMCRETVRILRKMKLKTIQNFMVANSYVNYWKIIHRTLLRNHMLYILHPNILKVNFKIHFIQTYKIS